MFTSSLQGLIQCINVSCKNVDNVIGLLTTVPVSMLCGHIASHKENIPHSFHTGEDYEIWITNSNILTHLPLDWSPWLKYVALFGRDIPCYHSDFTRPLTNTSLRLEPWDSKMFSIQNLSKQLIQAIEKWDC